MTKYFKTKLNFSDGQLEKLQKAYSSNQAVTLRLKRENLSGNHDINLTATQINRIQKSLKDGVGMDLTISKTQIRKAISEGGNLFSTLFSLAKPLIAPVAKALGTAGLTFGAEKALKGIFGSGIPPQAYEMYELFKKLTPYEKNFVQNYLAGKGIQVGSGQKGGLLGTIAASIGIPLAIDLFKKILGKGVHVKPAPIEKGKGMRLQPPQPFYGTWNTSTMPYIKRGAGKKKIRRQSVE